MSRPMKHMQLKGFSQLAISTTIVILIIYKISNYTSAFSDL